MDRSMRSRSGTAADPPVCRPAPRPPSAPCSRTRPACSHSSTTAQPTPAARTTRVLATWVPASTWSTCWCRCRRQESSRFTPTSLERSTSTRGAISYRHLRVRRTTRRRERSGLRSRPCSDRGLETGGWPSADACSRLVGHDEAGAPCVRGRGTPARNCLCWVCRTIRLGQRHRSTSDRRYRSAQHRSTPRRPVSDRQRPKLPDWSPCQRRRVLARLENRARRRPHVRQQRRLGARRLRRSPPIWVYDRPASRSLLRVGYRERRRTAASLVDLRGPGIHPRRVGRSPCLRGRPTAARLRLLAWMVDREKDQATSRRNRRLRARRIWRPSWVRRWVPPVRPLGGSWPNWDIAVSLVVQ